MGRMMTTRMAVAADMEMEIEVEMEMKGLLGGSRDSKVLTTMMWMMACQGLEVTTMLLGWHKELVTSGRRGTGRHRK